MIVNAGNWLCGGRGTPTPTPTSLIDASVLQVFVANVNAMVLNEFLKARRQIDAQQKQIEALIAGLQKVNPQLEVGGPAPQTVISKLTTATLMVVQ